MCLPPEPLNTVLPGAGPARQPTATPPFTVKDLRRAIPPHCFERSALRSSLYLVADLLAVAALFWASTFIDRAPAVLAWGLLWPAYW
jgi:omega-6 fatty acid desaturase (delta-12 desaturase)